MESERILIVDDDEKICQILTLYLRSKGYEVITCRNGANASQAFTGSAAQLIILDVNLPGLDGFTILERLRHISGVPVIMLTGCADEEARIRAFELGADDYITKPFNSKELLARIRAVLRRCGNQDLTAGGTVLTIGKLKLFREEHLAMVSDEFVKFSPREFDLLEYLCLRDMAQ